MNHFNLTDIFSATDIRKMKKLSRKEIRDQFVIPSMKKINDKTGQENDPDYISYAIEYILNR